MGRKSPFRITLVRRLCNSLYYTVQVVIAVFVLTFTFAPSMHDA